MSCSSELKGIVMLPLPLSLQPVSYTHLVECIRLICPFSISVYDKAIKDIARLSIRNSKCK